MKTILKTTLVIAFAAFVNNLYSSSNLRVDIVPMSSEKAVVAISTSSNCNFEITVADDKGRIVYSNKNPEPKENYVVEYDYSNLEDGVYKLAVISNDLTTERSFRKAHGTLKVGKEKTTLKPFFGYKDGILRCTYLNFPKEYMTLYFLKKNQVLYTSELGKIFSVSAGINLSDFDKGSYEAILSAGGKEYSYKIEKQ